MGEQDRMHNLVSLWQTHREAGWPKIHTPHEGELMTLDTVISGCVTYYLDSEGGLDPQRIDILETCLDDLNGLLPELEDEAEDYFARLRVLGGLLLQSQRRSDS